MSESITAMKLRGVCTREPDHSLLQWDRVTDDVKEIVEKKPPEMGKKHVVTENYKYRRICIGIHQVIC